MTKNPILNALAGLLYITLISTALFSGPGHWPIENTFFMPILVLSLFVFSAALMGYVFMYQPLQLFLEGNKKEAVNLFLKTLFVFALSAAALVLLGMSAAAYLG